MVSAIMHWMTSTVSTAAMRICCGPAPCGAASTPPLDLPTVSFSKIVHNHVSH